VSLTFEEPHIGLKESYRSLVSEFLDRGEDLVPFPLSFPSDDFDAFIERLSACSRGEGLPEGFVPHTTYWLVRDEVEVVGVSNLRHSLTDHLRHEGGHIGYGVRPSARRSGFATVLLRCTLEKAREKGIKEALVTCDKSNVASARTIIKNGGVLVSEEFVAEAGDVVQRYVVDTAAERVTGTI
jgi:predicted acetyltransferase